MTITFVNKFGSYGSGDGQFSWPRKITSDSNYIYVADTGNHRVQIFDKSTYAFVGKFGSLGSGDGEFNQPSGISVDSNYIYVSDTSNYRVQIFNKFTHAFVSKFGNSGIYAQIWGIAVDSNYIYISDQTSGYNNIWVVDINTHANIHQFGGYGTADGKFKFVFDIAVDDNYIYATDGTGNSDARIQILNKSTGAFVGKFGTPGTGDGQFHIYSGVYSLAVDSTTIYVADEIANRIQLFDKSTYSFIDKFGSLGTGDGEFGIVWGVEIDNGIICTLEQSNNFRVQIFSTTPPPPPDDPTLLTTTCIAGIGESVLPEAPFASFTASATSGLAPLTVNFTDTSLNTPTSWLWEKNGVSFSTSQNPSEIFTAGTWTVRLTATNASGSSVYQMTIIVIEAVIVLPPDGPGGPGTPGGGVVLPLPGGALQGVIGRIGYYVTDTLNNRVKIHGVDGALLKTFGTVGSGDGEFYMPTTCSVINGRQLMDRIVVNEE